MAVLTPPAQRTDALSLPVRPCPHHFAFVTASFQRQQAGAHAYKMLGVDQKATAAEIRKAYWKLSLLVHPDKCDHPGAQDAFHVRGKPGKPHALCCALRILARTVALLYIRHALQVHRR